MNSTKSKLRLLPLSNKVIPVYIDEELFYKIKYLCKLIPKEEWSGVVFYETEGSITDLKRFKITLKDVYPMDKGTGGFTSYEFDEKLVEFRMDNPHTLMMQIGHIHSHNVMPTFFSVVDSEELTDNSPHHNYYLSVIVNNYMDFSIRVASLAQIQSISMKDEDGNPYKVSNPQIEDVVVYYNGKIMLKEEQIPVTKEFASSVRRIIEKKKADDAKVNNQMAAAFNNSNNLQLAAKAIDDDEEKYDQFMNDFTISWLGQNVPVKLPQSDLEIAMKIINDSIEGENISEYVASTLSDYHKSYGVIFGEEVKAGIFLEDAVYVRDLLDEFNEKIESQLFNILIEQMNVYIEEFENSIAE